MKTKIYLTHEEVQRQAAAVAQIIKQEYKPTVGNPPVLYGWPRGGIPAVYLVADALRALQVGCRLASVPDNAHYIIDDIVDSGATRERAAANYPQARFLALVENSPNWVVFPWEVQASGEDASAEDVAVRLLQWIGEDPSRGGLRETPARVMKAWKEWTSGHGVDPSPMLKTFEDGAEGSDEMVVVQDIPVYSHCEHHLAPFFGKATVAYIPNGKVVGLSKLARVVDVFSRRLQVQERLTNQIADCLQEALNPLGVGVTLQCRHMCMESRGIKAPGCSTVTTALRGAIKEQPQARAEFLSFVKKEC